MCEKTATWWEMQGSLRGWEAAWAVIKVTLVGQAGAASGTLHVGVINSSNTDWEALLPVTWPASPKIVTSQ